MDKGLIEHEFDHVFIGRYDGPLKLNFTEAGDYCYKSIPDLKHDIITHPLKYTAWFQIAFPMLESHLIKLN